MQVGDVLPDLVRGGGKVVDAAAVHVYVILGCVTLQIVPSAGGSAHHRCR